MRRTPRMREVITRADLIDVAKTILLGAPLFAWVVMLALGAFIHPVGYWPLLGICLAVGLLSVPFELRMKYMDRTGSRY